MRACGYPGTGLRGSPGGTAPCDGACGDVVVRTRCRVVACEVCGLWCTCRWPRVSLAVRDGDGPPVMCRIDSRRSCTCAAKDTRPPVVVGGADAATGLPRNEPPALPPRRRWPGGVSPPGRVGVYPLSPRCRADLLPTLTGLSTLKGLDVAAGANATGTDTVSTEAGPLTTSSPPRLSIGRRRRLRTDGPTAPSPRVSPVPSAAGSACVRGPFAAVTGMVAAAAGVPVTVPRAPRPRRCRCDRLPATALSASWRPWVATG